MTSEHRGRLTAELIAFYRDEGRTPSGYSRAQILGWPDDKWELHHDFIQWVFPLDEPSRFNLDAPVLDVATITQWRADSLLRERMKHSFGRWLQFCGIVRTNAGLILECPNPDVWDGPNHNWLRITRVLRSLTLLGLDDEADAFFALLTTVRSRIDQTTWNYWAAARLAGR